MGSDHRKYSDLSSNEKRELAKRLLQERAGRRVSEARTEQAATGISGEIPPQFYRLELFPEYRQMEARALLVRESGLLSGNPYYLPHESVSSNRIRVAGKDYVNFSGYNYLGMSGDPRVSGASKLAIDTYGTSVSASRIVSGEIPLHAELERALAELLNAEACVVLVSGWGTNVSTVGHLARSNDLIVHDALVHNSIIMGCVLSGARRIAFPHNDVAALDRILAENRHHYERVLVIAEGVYSMDGDIAPLPEFITVKRKHKTLLMIDEAHSIGVLGQTGGGIREYFGVASGDVDIWMGTLSKAFASCGGYIAGSRALVDNLKYLSSGLVYSVGLSPANTAAALAALHVMRAEPERLLTLRARSEQFLQLAKAHKLNTGPSHDSPVIPIILGNSLACMRLSQELVARGIEAKPVMYPAVAESEARVRFFVTALHTEEEIGRAVDAVAEIVRRMIAEKLIRVATT